jgi:hypothetical protein
VNLGYGRGVMWGPTVECSAALQAATREIRAASLVLKVHARDARGALRLCGGSSDDADAILCARIVAVILERPTCLTCLAPKIGASMPEVMRAIAGIGQTVNVRVARGERCRACGSTVGPTYSLPR